MYKLLWNDKPMGLFYDLEVASEFMVAFAEHKKFTNEDLKSEVLTIVPTSLKKIFEITSILTPGYWDGESYQQISDVNKTEVQLMRWNKDVCRCVKLDELKEYEGKTVTVTISVED